MSEFRAKEPYFKVAPFGSTDDVVKAFEEHFWATPYANVDAVGPELTSPSDTAKRNAYRANHVVVALEAYAKQVGGSANEPFDQMIRDLLSDLMHLVDMLGEDEDGDSLPFDYLVGSAYTRYAEEVDGQ